MREEDGGELHWVGAAFRAPGLCILDLTMPIVEYGNIKVIFIHFSLNMPNEYKG